MKLSVPFVVRSGLLGGFVETEGIASFDGEVVKIEFRTADSVVGVLKSKVHEVNIPVSGINGCYLGESGRGWWRQNFLCIKVAEMGRASEVPTFNMGMVSLPITDVQAATELASAVRVAGGLNTRGS
jgi:hypothetical protein